MKKLFILLFTILLFTACNSDSGGGGDSTATPTDTPETTYNGKLEKGAFQKGAEIIAYGWSAVNGFTGESFATTTTDNLGNYTLKSSKIKDLLYVKADGYFFNENTAVTSDSTLKLYGIIDSTKVPWNINVLTHIIKDRVTFLLESGSTYDESVSQSMNELYANFNWTAVNPGTISITTSPELLLLSAAVCKDRTVSEISSLLTTLSADFEDGTVDVSALDNSFYAVDVTTVQDNITALHGSSPSIGATKTALLAFRSITGPPPKVYIVTPLSTADFYYFTINTKQLYKIANSAMTQITFNVTTTQSGYSDIVQTGLTANEFFGGSGTYWFSINLDGGLKYFKQESGVVSQIDQSAFPVHPAKGRSQMNNGSFEIFYSTYDVYDLNDVRNLTSPGGIFRTLRVTGYHLGSYGSSAYGMFFAVEDPTNIAGRDEGLYYWDESDWTAPVLIKGDYGEMW